MESGKQDCNRMKFMIKVCSRGLCCLTIALKPAPVLSFFPFCFHTDGNEGLCHCSLPAGAQVHRTHLHTVQGKVPHLFMSLKLSETLKSEKNALLTSFLFFFFFPFLLFSYLCGKKTTKHTKLACHTAYKLTIDNFIIREKNEKHYSVLLYIKLVYFLNYYNLISMEKDGTKAAH